MTWGEFKKAVEAAGVEDDYALHIIDWNYGEVDLKDHITVDDIMKSFSVL